jgi:hypothetical protein
MVKGFTACDHKCHDNDVCHVLIWMFTRGIIMYMRLNGTVHVYTATAGLHMMFLVRYAHMYAFFESCKIHVYECS